MRLIHPVLVFGLALGLGTGLGHAQDQKHPKSGTTKGTISRGDANAKDENIKHDSAPNDPNAKIEAPPEKGGPRPAVGHAESTSTITLPITSPFIPTAIIVVRSHPMVIPTDGWGAATPFFTVGPHSVIIRQDRGDRVPIILTDHSPGRSVSKRYRREKTRPHLTVSPMQCGLRPSG